MAISGIPTTAGNDTVVVTAPGIYGDSYIYGGDGIDKMIIDWSSLTNDIVCLEDWYGYRYFADDFFNSVRFEGFESVTFQGGSGSDDLRGTGGNDELYGNAGDDNLSGGLGADVLDGGGWCRPLVGGLQFPAEAGGGGVARCCCGGLLHRGRHWSQDQER